MKNCYSRITKKKKKNGKKR